jgi:ABC-2 type transport system permease protein
MQQILAVMYREYLIRRTSPLWLFFDVAVPLLYLLMFGVALDKALGFGLQLGDGSVGYNRFFLAGVLSMTCFGSAINQSYGFFVDRDNGILYEFLTYPMTRGQFLLGKILFQCVMSIVQGVLTLLLAQYVLGIDVMWELVLFILIGVVIGTSGWFFFLAILAFRIRRNDTFNTAINVAYFVLIFLSTTFYPIDQAPDWLKISSYLNPLTWHTDVLRYLTVGIGSLELVVLQAIGFSIFLLISFWFAVRALQRWV